jgi:hypothetical protein
MRRMGGKWWGLARHRGFLAVVVSVILMLARTARADDPRVRTCQGPSACCPDKVDPDVASGPVSVDVGVVLVGLYGIDEKTQSWTADFYLYEAWIPTPAFVPQTEIVNEISRLSEQFDTTELAGGRCMRTRRIRSTLHSEFVLRTFPFDHQTLVLEVSDADYDSSEVRYHDVARVAGLEETVVNQVTGWKLESSLNYLHSRRAFKWEEGAPDYDHASFSVSIRRHVSFHVSKYFLPLLLLVIVSFSAFWIDPEDLASELQVGVTCLLAVIALQFAEGSTLPDVSYLTIADRAYSICYVAIALAILQSILTNRIARAGRKDAALAIDKCCRWAFPLGLAVALVGAIVRAYTQGR